MQGGTSTQTIYFNSLSVCLQSNCPGLRKYAKNIILNPYTSVCMCVFVLQFEDYRLAQVTNTVRASCTGAFMPAIKSSHVHARGAWLFLRLSLPSYRVFTACLDVWSTIKSTKGTFKLASTSKGTCLTVDVSHTVVSQLNLEQDFLVWILGTCPANDAESTFLKELQLIRGQIIVGIVGFFFH